MYEGVTEYLIYFKSTKDWLLRTNSTTEFQKRLKEQNNERQYVFTTMSAKVLTQPYKDQYVNVYQKAR
jgi:hypothetical protein